MSSENVRLERFEKLDRDYPSVVGWTESTKLEELGRIPIKGTVKFLNVGLAYYLAGYFDGEGCIWCDSSTRCSVGNTFPDILEKFHIHFGGSIRRKNKIAAHHKSAYEWYISGDGARNFVKTLAPFLIEKRDQAMILSRVFNYPPHSEGRKECKTILKALKKKNRVLETL
jgi:hypothetical protein